VGVLEVLEEALVVPPGDLEVEDSVVEEVLMMLSMLEAQELVVIILRRSFLDCQEKITQFTQKFQIPHSSVMDRQMEDITQTQRLNVRCSTFVQEMAQVDSQNTAFSAPMELFSTSNTLFATGGSMLTAPWLSLSTL